MNIHEFQAKELLREFGIKVCDGVVVSEISQVDNALNKLGGEIFAIKAQIHAGGRAKAGGVKIAKNKDEAKAYAAQILGTRLVTEQTSKSGILVNKIYIEKGLKFTHEYYVGFVFDRTHECVSLIVSKDGGVSIEETAKHRPELIKSINIDPIIGFSPFYAQQFLAFLGFERELGAKFVKFLNALYDLYIQKEALLCEINPLVLGNDGEFYALDAKLSFDDSALFRHPEILALNDESQSEPSENAAREHRLSYIKLDGSVGCVVNGAGLAMATMDIIKELGGDAANFLDVGGAASEQGVALAFELIVADKNVKVIFVNIFGGIVRCDLIANGIVKAYESLNLSVPVVVRLDGTNKDVAFEILNSCKQDGLHAKKGLFEAAKLAVALAGGAK